MLRIQLDQKPAEYRPGDSITGNVQWDQLDPGVERLEIRLIWYTQGKGTKDIDLCRSQILERPGSSGRESFEFQAPHRPFSFSGKLISLVWAVEAIEFPGREATHQRVSISPTGSEVRLENSYTEEIGERATFKLGRGFH